MKVVSTTHILILQLHIVDRLVIQVPESIYNSIISL
uniref:Uncharacterized protein n=1 Tax=Podoviridae sp. ct8Lf7 TaxID=2827723 RepID=A0A8S5S0S1_9CAUD|nr:MAG TPA: hypothetical protein [Podoviridae sp. ct8Lf7]